MKQYTAIPMLVSHSYLPSCEEHPRRLLVEHPFLSYPFQNLSSPQKTRPRQMEQYHSNLRLMAPSTEGMQRKNVKQILLNNDISDLHKLSHSDYKNT